MSLFTIIIVVVVVGIVLFLINRFIPMDAKIKQILNWVVIIILIIWLLNAFGVLNYLKGIHI